MTDKLKSFEKFLNLLLLFLFPTQLALHLWPDFSFIFGLRVDYLSPTIYLTDILFIFLFIWWFVGFKKPVLKDINKNRNVLALLLIVGLINIFLSQNIVVTAIKWTKIFEYVMIAYYVFKRRDVFTIKSISLTLFLSLLIFCVVGLLQFINGRTFGNLFYIVGERRFSVFTPGVALANVFGRNFLRSYSTFPHPNAFAGFLGAGFLFLLTNLNFKYKYVKTAGMFFILIVFVLTFSLASDVGLIIGLTIYFLNSKKIVFGKFIANVFLMFVFIVSLGLMYVAKPLLLDNQNLPQSYSQRLELASISSKIYSKNWIVGNGLNTFILKEVDYSNGLTSAWFLQPVHNIYLLVLTEAGISGLVLLYVLFYKLVNISLFSNNKWGITVIIFILVTGLFDHYWFTIQQNLLLASLSFGLIFRQKKITNSRRLTLGKSKTSC